MRPSARSYAALSQRNEALITALLDAEESVTLAMSAVTTVQALAAATSSYQRAVLLALPHYCIT